MLESQEAVSEPRLVPGTDIPIVAFDPSALYRRPAGETMNALSGLRDIHGAFVRSSVGPRGFWVLTSLELMREAYQKPDIFSSTSPNWWDPDPAYKWIPSMLDAPEHTKWRQLMSPRFTPRRVEDMEESLRTRCGSLIDGLVTRGSCDYVKDFAQIYPTTVFLDLMGLPSENLDRFLHWESEILHLPMTEEFYPRLLTAMEEVRQAFRDEIVSRQAKGVRNNDLLGDALTWEIDGAPIPEDELLGFCLLLFMAGLDTVTSELAYATWHLAQHSDDRQRLLEDPDLIPTAIEEFLRFYNIVAPGRQVTQDITFHGCPMRAGDQVFMAITIGNRDGEEFVDADRVVIDRAVNNHIGFGAGPHRCVGSHLARREMRVALEEWHKRIPHYRLQSGADVSEHYGVMIGMTSLPIEWNT